MKKLSGIFILLFMVVGCQTTINNNIKGDSTSSLLIKKEVTGNSMEPLISEGEKVFLDDVYYQKEGNAVMIGDIILYDFKGDKHPIIKTVVARDSDIVEITNNTLFVNGKEISNSAGKEYNFTQAEQSVLKMYIDKEKKIPKNSIFILGDNVEVSVDSRKFGAVSLNDILGKITR